MGFTKSFNSIRDVFNISKHILMLADRLHFHMRPTIPQQIYKMIMKCYQNIPLTVAMKT